MSLNYTRPVGLLIRPFIQNGSDRNRNARQVILHFRNHRSTASRHLSLSHHVFEPPTPDNNRLPFFATHGLLGSKSNWASIAKAIAKSTNRKVVTFDARNHGDSPHTDTMSYEEMSNDIVELAGELGVRKFSLLGHSMGGRTSMAFALAHPEFVEKLVVVDVSPVSIGADFGEMESYLQGLLNQKFGDTITTLSAARKLADQRLESIAKSKAIRAFLLTNLAKSDIKGIYWKPNLSALLRNLHEIKAFPEHLKSKTFSNPTLIIRGELSPYVPDSDIDKIKSIFTNAQVATIAGTGHWPHSEKSTEFLNILGSFLNDKLS